MNTNVSLCDRAAAVAALACLGAIAQAGRTRQSLALRLQLRPAHSERHYPELYDIGPSFSGGPIHTPVAAITPTKRGRETLEQLRAPTLCREALDSSWSWSTALTAIPEKIFAGLWLTYEHGLFARGAVVDGKVATAIYMALLGLPYPRDTLNERQRLWLPAELAPNFNCYSWQHVEAGWAPLAPLAKALGIQSASISPPGSRAPRTPAPRDGHQVGEFFTFTGPLFGLSAPAWREACLFVPVISADRVLIARVPPPESVLPENFADEIRKLFAEDSMKPLQALFTSLRDAELSLSLHQGSIRSTIGKVLRAGREHASKFARVHLQNIEVFQRVRQHCQALTPVPGTVTRDNRTMPSAALASLPVGQPVVPLTQAAPSRKDQEGLVVETSQHDVCLPSGAVVHARRRRLL